LSRWERHDVANLVRREFEAMFPSMPAHSPGVLNKSDNAERPGGSPNYARLHPQLGDPAEWPSNREKKGGAPGGLRG
jgi:hypothetical protein